MYVYVQFFKVIPTGICHVKFKLDGHHYTWKKPITTIHNILVGSLYVDQVCIMFMLFEKLEMVCISSSI